MKRLFLLPFLFVWINSHIVHAQEKKQEDVRIMVRGLVSDARNLSPVSGAQILINGDFSSISDKDGSFSFYAARKDTIIFTSLGFRPVTLMLPDTTAAREFLAGIFLQSDTISIGEVVIVPKFLNLRSEIINGSVKTSRDIENARYNVAVSAYQAKTGIGSTGDPVTNYSMISRKQKLDASERGGIPSDKIAGLSPFMLIPAAYLLMNGLPPKPAPMTNTLSDKEIEEINQRYFELVKSRK